MHALYRMAAPTNSAPAGAACAASPDAHPTVTGHRPCTAPAPAPGDPRESSSRADERPVPTSGLSHLVGGAPEVSAFRSHENSGVSAPAVSQLNLLTEAKAQKIYVA